MTKTQDPTDAELGILAVLWRLGPATVRQIHEALHPKQDTGYTTTLKLMQVMTQKGLLKRDASQRSHIYRPARSEAQTQKSLVKKLIDTAFFGSAPALAMRALATKSASKEELDELRSLLDEMEAKIDV